MSETKILSDSLLTSHQAGSLLQVNPSSINKWVQQGHIEAFRTPGGHRRIRAGDLVRFLNSHAMPVPQALAGAARRRLLLVDDDRRQLASWKALFGPYRDRVEMEAVDNGIEALVRVGAFKPHVIILDVIMPEVDGIEVCRRLMANPETRDIRILVTSGQLDAQLQQRALDAGALGCLEKPVRLAQVLEVLGVDLRPAVTPDL